MDTGVVVRQPSLRVDTVEDVIGDVKGEVQIFAVVFDVPGQGQVFRVFGWCELGDPARYTRELVASEYSPGEMTPSTSGVVPA